MHTRKGHLPQHHPQHAMAASEAMLTPRNISLHQDLGEIRAEPEEIHKSRRVGKQRLTG
jgi:hypothetical protein